MATHDAEVLAQMLRSLTDIIDAKLDKLEHQRESDARLQAENHGENRKSLENQTSDIKQLQRQMSSLTGEGPIDGCIGTMQRELSEVKDKLETMQWKIIGLLAAILMNFGTMIMGYLLTRK